MACLYGDYERAPACACSCACFALRRPRKTRKARTFGARVFVFCPHFALHCNAAILIPSCAPFEPHLHPHVSDSPSGSRAQSGGGMQFPWRPHGVRVRPRTRGGVALLWPTAAQSRADFVSSVALKCFYFTVFHPPPRHHNCARAGVGTIVSGKMCATFDETRCEGSPNYDQV